MEKLIRKGTAEQFNYFFSFSFSWDYFYFYSASYLLYKKIDNCLSNELNKMLYIPV